MIFVLNGADFSENNIGKIVLPKSLNSFTKTIFAHCTKYNIDSAQAYIVNDFVETLAEANILQHIAFMNAPWLAANIDEALFDLVSETQLVNPDNMWILTDKNGINKTSEARYTTPLPKRLPSKNFFGTIKLLNLSYSSPMFLGTNMCFDFSASEEGCVYNTLNFSKGIKNSKSSQVRLIEKLINSNESIDWTNANNLLINGQQGYAGDGGSSFILGDYVDDFGSWEGSNQQAYIGFAGDGTALTSEQRTILMAAMTKLRTDLVNAELH